MKAFGAGRFLSRLICAVSLLFGATQVQAGTAEDAKQLFLDTDELAAFAGQAERLNPIAGGLSGEVDVFGAKASAFLYFPDPLSKPVIALLLPSVALSTIVPPLADTPTDVRLDNPLIIIGGSEGYLDVARMPSEVAARVQQLGLASSFKVENGFNIFGGVGSRNDLLHQVLSLANLNSPLVAGFSSPSKKVVVDSKKTKFKYRVLSLALPPDHAWNAPFFMRDVSVQGAVLRMKTPKDVRDGTTSFQVIGGASIGGTVGYHVFIERAFDKKNPSKSTSTLLAINPDRAITMGDFLSISRAMGNMLGLPSGGLPDARGIPLGQIRLENPFNANLAFPEEGAPPDFAKVMFAGASPMTKIPDRLLPGPLLTANARAKVFGFEASDLRLNFDLTGINATAGVKLPKLGPVTLARASLDMAIRPNAAPHMLLHTDSQLGAVTVEASSSGLSFAIPGQCPLEPVGMKASLNGFDPTRDFSIAPDIKDCLSDELKEFVEDVGGKATHAVKELAEDTAETANGLMSDAKGQIMKLEDVRMASWTNALNTKTAATMAKAEAIKALDRLTTTVTKLTESIDSLTRWIEDALESAWNAVKGEVNKKKKELSEKIAQRDRALTEKASAKQRFEQAREAEQLAAAIPVPSQDPALRATQEQQLGHMAILAQQTRIAGAAKKLPNELATAEARKRLIDAHDIAPYFARAKTQWIQQNGTSLASYVQKGKFKVLSVKPSLGSASPRKDAIRIPSGEAVFTDLIDRNLRNTTARILREEVSSLPTMAYGKRVLVQTVVDGRVLCMTMKAEPRHGNMAYLEACDSNRPEQRFVFEASGIVRIPDVELPVKLPVIGNQKFKAPCLRYPPREPPSLMGYPCQVAMDSPYSPSSPDPTFLFFFDPMDGLIRGAANTNYQGVVRPAGNRCVGFGTISVNDAPAVPAAFPRLPCQDRDARLSPMEAVERAAYGALETLHQIRIRHATPPPWRLVEVTPTGVIERSAPPPRAQQGGAQEGASNTGNSVRGTNLAPLYIE